MIFACILGLVTARAGWCIARPARGKEGLCSPLLQNGMKNPSFGCCAGSIDAPVAPVQQEYLCRRPGTSGGDLKDVREDIASEIKISMLLEGLSDSRAAASRRADPAQARDSG